MALTQPLFGFACQVLPIFLLLECFAPSARGQIVPDATLRNNSIVNLVGSQWNITGGETIGGNLLHSFSTFNVRTGETALFDNAPSLQNIIARVTGGTISTIDGLIQTQGVANLFLINPSGIIFGANAQLNINGSFFASTAESVVFSDGSTFSATNPQAPSLLTVNVPIGLQIGSNPGNIAVKAQSLQVFPERTLGLIGGALQLEGAQLQAARGRIELGGVGANGFVRLAPNAANIEASYEGVSNFQDIQLSNATVDVSGLGGGTIQVQGRRVIMNNGSGLASLTLGSAAGGDIIVRGSESVSAIGDNPSKFTSIFIDTLGTGTGGDAIIETKQFLLQGTAIIALRAFSSGTGGRNLTIRASEQATVVGLGLDALEQFLVSAFSGQVNPNPSNPGQVNPSNPFAGLFTTAITDGRGGNITIETGSLSLQNGALVASTTFGGASSGSINIRAAGSVDVVGSAIATIATLGSQGSAGNIEIDTGQLTARDGSLISIVTFGNEPSGDIEIVASDFVELNRTLPNAIFPTGITNNSFGTGAGGDIKIATRRFINRDGAIIGATSGGVLGTGFLPFGGPGGDILIEARESVEITGSAANRFAGQAGGELVNGPGTTTFTSFPAGDLTIRTRRLTLADGAFIDSATLSSGNGGNLLIEASESVELIGKSRITGFPTSITTSSGRPDSSRPIVTGKGGNLTINTRDLIVRDGATLDVSSFGVGDAGTLEVSANSIFLDRGSSLNASTVSGLGGNVFLEAPTILLRRGSTISTNAGDAAGGNIRINTTNLVAVPRENSDIIANSLNFRGGNITINAAGSILGLRFRPQRTPRSDITATGRDSSLEGTVILNTLFSDPASGLQELPEDVSDPSDRVVFGCAAATGNSFVITGRGGLPEDPRGTLRGQTVWKDFRDWPVEEVSEPVTAPVTAWSTEFASQPLIEAQHWTINEAGNVELIAARKHEPRFPLRASRCARSGTVGSNFEQK